MRAPRSLSEMSRLEQALLSVGARALQARMRPAAWRQLKYCWPALERPSVRLPPLPAGQEPGWGRWTGQQEPPGHWLYWLFCGGRGVGKSRRLTQFILDRARRFPGCRIALVARTTRTLWNDCVEGDSGLVACSPPWFAPRPRFNAGQIVYPNESKVILFTAEEPDNIRGPNNHFGADEELCAQPKAIEAWRQMQATMRKGRHPQTFVATTPRPVPLLLDLLKNPHSAVTRGSSYENAANLAESWLQQNVAQWEGTLFGRQEIDGEVLEEVQGALFDTGTIERHRVETAPPLKRVAIALDPAGLTYAEAKGMASEAGDEDDRALAGLVAAGLGEDGHVYVLEDASCERSPDKWVRETARLFGARKADVVLYEKNHGGKAVEEAFRAAKLTLPLRGISARRGKYARAEPVSVLYRKGLVHHVGGFGNRERAGLTKLEEQMCSWTPAKRKSPDRLDALVYVVLDLAGLVEGSEPLIFR